MISYLQAENISRRIGDKLLFEGVDLNINKGDKTGLVAVNGAGKSTLLDILSGSESPDTGSLSIRRGLKTAYLRQSPGLIDSNRVMDEFFHQETSLEYEVTVKQILYKLQITDLHARIATLSGGQKKRVALAKVLAEDADLLILDEPTNHLDIDMIEWLEDFLIKSKKTVLMVTHDRYFLDRICTVILELDRQEIIRYEGNYEYFLEKKQEREANARTNSEKARNLLRTELDWMRRMPKARRHKSKSRIDAFYDLKERAAPGGDEKSINIMVRVSRMGKKILELKDLHKSFDDKHLLKGFSYIFNRYEKAGLVGPNGSGKTTLLNVITGSLPPDSGSITVGETIIFGYYRQEGMSFDEDSTVIDCVKKIAETVTLRDNNTMTASQFLNYFLFPPDKQFTLVRKLSGGEKRRLYLLTVLMRSPNFLILDEPTNDLDILTLNVLEEYLAGFPGCVVIVSHDRYFMDKVVEHVFEFKGDGTIRYFEGNYTQLREKQKDEEKLHDSVKPSKSASTEPVAKKEKKQGLTFKEKKEFEQLSAEIADLESEKKDIEEKMVTGKLATDELYALSVKHGDVVRLLDEKELRWLELSEK